MMEKKKDFSSTTDKKDSQEALSDEAINHHAIGAAVNCTSFQALTSKKRAKPIYPVSSMDRFPAFSSSWPCQGREAASSSCPCCCSSINNSHHSAALHVADTEHDTEAKSVDSKSSSEERRRASQDRECSTLFKNRDVIFLCPASVIEQSRRQQATTYLSSISLGQTQERKHYFDAVDGEDDEERQKQSQQIRAIGWHSKASPWEDEACGASGCIIGPEITTSKSRPKLKRNDSQSDLDQTQRRIESMDADDENCINNNIESTWVNDCILDAPEMTEAVHQQSLMSVPGAIAVAGISARTSSDTDVENETTISMHEAMRRISSMDARGVEEDNDDAVEMTAAIRQQSMMSVPGAVAIEGINGRFGSDADSDDETTASMQESLRYLQTNRSPDEILVQGVLAADESLNTGAYVSVAVIRQARVIDAEGIHVLRVDDDELDEPNSMTIKASHWGGGLVCLVVVAALVCVVIFFTIGKQNGKNHISTTTESPTVAPTLAPTNSEFPKIVDVLKSITSEAVLQDRSSPQFMAAEWLSRDVGDKELPQEKLLQRYVLSIMQFAYGITFICDDRTCNYHHSSTPFLTEADECTWNGITCNDDGLVTRILLFDRSTDLVLNDIVKWKPSAPMGKTGKLSSEIITLTELSVLVMEGFAIAGSIEHIFHPNLKNLRTIRLTGNALTGSLPGDIWKTHPNLEILDVSNNVLSGPLPNNIGRIPSLKSLNLRNNNINGSIPSLIGSLTSLEMIDLGETLVEGSLPSEIVGCSESLLTLDLSNTKMSGPLPVEMELFHSLQTLNLEGCAFDGLIPELSCKNTQVIRLNENNFSGTIPSSLGLCTSLEQLNLRDNPRLKGIIPNALCGDVWDYKQEFTSFSVDCDIVCDCCDFNPRCDDDW